MFNRFRAWFSRWMSGRYGGGDELSRFLFVVYLICFVAGLLFQLFEATLWLAVLFDLLTWVVLGISLFRMLSRHIQKRWEENQRYLLLRTRVKEWLKLTRHRLRDIRTKRYRRCPHCRAVVRFPIKRGVHIVSCPHCRQKFELKIRL